MKAVLAASICSLALACGGTQPSTDSATPTAPPQAHSHAAGASGSTAELASVTAALAKLSQEQAEMFQLFQLLAGQVQGLQDQVEALRGQQAEQAAAAEAPLPRPSRPRPDPESVYSIEIKNNPSRGSKQPLVTIVEAFEFA